MNKPGRLYGTISFINIIVLLYSTLFISIFFPNVNLDSIIIIDKIAFGIFSLTWTYVFGSGAIKKLKNKEDKQ